MKLLTLFAAFSFTALAGGLYLEIDKGTSGALLTARVTSCHEPAKSIVKASIVTIVDGQLKRQSLTVEPVSNQVGLYAITGSLPAENVVIELSVTNPQFGSYQPRFLIRAGARKIELGTKRFFSNLPPTLADYRQALAS